MSELDREQQALVDYLAGRLKGRTWGWWTGRTYRELEAAGLIEATAPDVHGPGYALTEAGRQRVTPND